MQIKIALKFLVLFGIAAQPFFTYGQDETYNDRKSYYTKSQISEADKLKVFNNLFEIVNRMYFDSTFNGRDWAKLRVVYEPQAQAAANKSELKDVLNRFVGELKTSHLNVSYEIGISGKTLDKMFGDNIEYKKNYIFFGYGYSTAAFDNQTVVTEVEKNSNAEQSGVKPGWIVKSCESHPLTKKLNDNLVFTETADCVFSTEAETEKKLTLSQSWFLMPRSNTQRFGKLLAHNILYLKFTRFDDGSAEWIKQQIAAHISAKAVIVDLRSNGGGLLSELKKSLSIFFPAPTVIGQFIERDLDEKSARVGSDNPYQGQVVVLINGSSYSASEIFAAAFQEFERGWVIGQKSGGQVLNSVTKSLSNGFTLLIAFRDFKTVKGVRLEGRGVTPDVEVPFSILDFRLQHDVILEKALKILNE